MEIYGCWLFGGLVSISVPEKKPQWWSNVGAWLVLVLLLVLLLAIAFTPDFRVRVRVPSKAEYEYDHQRRGFVHGERRGGTQREEEKGMGNTHLR